MRGSCRITFGYSLVAATAPPAQTAISGDDDRTEYFQGAVTRKQAADGVFALIHDSHIDHSDPMDVRFVNSRYGEVLGLCPEERFRGQPDPTGCGALPVPSGARDVGSRGGLTFERRSVV